MMRCRVSALGLLAVISTAMIVGAAFADDETPTPEPTNTPKTYCYGPLGICYWIPSDAEPVPDSYPVNDCVECLAYTPTPTETPTPEPTATPTDTPTPLPTDTPPPTPTPTATAYAMLYRIPYDWQAGGAAEQQKINRQIAHDLEALAAVVQYEFPVLSIQPSPTPIPTRTPTRTPSPTPTKAT